MLVGSLDLETTGLEEGCEIIEVGLVIYDPESKKVHDVFSSLVIASNPLPPAITELTHITDEMLKKFGRHLEEIIAELVPKLESCDFVMAHNSDFDRGFLERAFKKTKATLPEIHWIDTKIDAPWSNPSGSHSLSALCNYYGVQNRFAHRAVFDAMTVIELTNKFSFNVILARRNEPVFEIEALVSFEQKDRAKRAGFHWDGQRKKWLRKMKKSDYEGARFDFQSTTALLR